MQSLQMQLLHLLQEDRRLPLEKLAVMTGSTVETVATVIDDMERSGIILSLRARHQLGQDGPRARGGHDRGARHPQRDQGFDAIAERIYRFDEVKSVYLMSGAVRPSAAGGGAYPQASWPSLSAPSSARWKPSRARPRISCSRRYKSDGVIFEGNDGDKRLVVTA